MKVVDIKSFLKEAVGEKKEVKLERFEEPFVIEAISETENDRLKKSSTVSRRAKGGNIIKDMNTDKYSDGLLSRCVVSPDLSNAEIQGFYNTEGDTAATLKAMLLAGEYTMLTTEVLELNGFGETDGEIIDEIKK